MNPWRPCKNKEEAKRLFRLTPAASSARSIEAMIEVGWTIDSLLQHKFIEGVPAQPLPLQVVLEPGEQFGEPWKDPADMATFQKHLLHQIASVFSGQQSHLNSTHQRCVEIAMNTTQDNVRRLLDDAAQKITDRVIREFWRLYNEELSK